MQREKHHRSPNAGSRASAAGPNFTRKSNRSSLGLAIEWNAVIAANLTSAFAVVSAAAKSMRQRGGSIVLVSSAAARLGLANHEAIAAAKAGVIGLTLSAAATYASKGIRSCAGDQSSPSIPRDVAPGPFQEFALLHGDRRHARQRLVPLMSKTRHVAEQEDVGLARHGQILLHRHTPRPIDLDPRQHRDSLREGGCLDTGCP